MLDRRSNGYLAVALMMFMAAVAWYLFRPRSIPPHPGAAHQQKLTVSEPNDQSLLANPKTLASPVVLNMDFTQVPVLSALPICVLPGSDHVMNIVMNQAGTLFATKMTFWPDTSIRLWNSTTCELVKKLEGHKNYINAVTFSEDGTKIASVSADYSARVWAVSSGKQLQSVLHSSRAERVSFSPNGRLVGSGADDDAKLWDASTGRVFRTFDKASNPNLAFSADSKLVAIVNDRVPDPETKSMVRVFRVEAPDVLSYQVVVGVTGLINFDSLEFSADGRYLVVGAKYIDVFRAADGELVQSFRPGSDPLYVSKNRAELRYSPPLVFAKEAHAIRAWDSESGRPRFVVSTGDDISDFIVRGHTLIFWAGRLGLGVRLWKCDFEFGQ